MLTLADGTRLVLRAGDEKAAHVVAFLAGKARLALAQSPLPPGTRHLVVVGEEQDAASPAGRMRYASNVPVAEGDIVCVLEPSDAQRPRRRQSDEDGPRFVSEPLTEEEWFWQQLARLSATIGRETQPKGGVLLHSGLAHTPPPHSLPSPAPFVGERRGKGQSRRGRGEGGFLLAGRSAVGKSTASQRLPSPWHSLADDFAHSAWRAQRGGDVFGPSLAYLELVL